MRLFLTRLNHVAPSHESVPGTNTKIQPSASGQPEAASTAQDSWDLYLLRHTPVDVPKGHCYGRMEVPLSPGFHEDASRVLAHLESVEAFTHVFSSPLERCHRLAQSLTSAWSHRGRQVIWESLEDLQEVSFGHWEGKRWDEIDPGEIGPWYEDFVERAPPGGESMRALSERAQRALGDIQKRVLLATCAEQNHDGCPLPGSSCLGRPRVLCVSHGGWIRALMGSLLDMPLASTFKLKVDYGDLAGFTIQVTRQITMQATTPTLVLLRSCLA